MDGASGSRGPGDAREYFGETCWVTPCKEEKGLAQGWENVSCVATVVQPGFYSRCSLEP